MPALMGGDVLLVHGDSVSGRLIRWAQRRRITAGSFWDHVALLVSETELIEATSAGVVRSPITKYAQACVGIAHVETNDLGRRRAVRYAEAQLGRRYDWRDALDLGLAALSGSWVRLPRSRAYTCAELVGCALEWAGVAWARPTARLLPADIAVHLGVEAYGESYDHVI